MATDDAIMAVWQQVFRSNPATMLLIDPDDGRILDASDRAVAFYGYPHATLTGLRIWDLNQLGRAEVERRLVEARRGDGNELRFPHRLANGDIRQVQVLSAPVVQDGGLRILSVIRDITTELETAAERDRLAVAIEQATETVVITDLEARINYVNPAFERTTGYTREEALGQNPRILGSGQQSPAFYREMWDTLLRGESWTGEFVNRRRDGGLYRELATISPVRDAAGTIANYLAVKRDITHEHELEEQLRQAAKMEAVGRLAGGIAHDFNNLLTAILGYETLVEAALPEDAPILDDVRQIRRSAERAAELTRGLLGFARKTVLTPEVVSLNAVVDDVTLLVRRLLGERVTMHVHTHPATGQVRVDRARLEQVIVNLAVNARDAMPEGGRLFLATRPANAAEFGPNVPFEGQAAVLEVSDTGHGIPVEALPNIFEPFFTTKMPDGGTGLGLATSYGIVRQSGGTMTVRSAPGAGATFQVVLPVAGAIVAEQVPAERPAPPVAPRKATILVVEDESSIRDLIRRILIRGGYGVVTAATPAEAQDLGAAEFAAVDLLVTDVVMPGVSGPEMVRAFESRRPGLPVLYVSGYAGSLDPERELSGERCLFLPKPFSPRDLLDRVATLLEGATVEGATGTSGTAGDQSRRSAR